MERKRVAGWGWVHGWGRAGRSCAGGGCGCERRGDRSRHQVVPAGGKKGTGKKNQSGQISSANTAPVGFILNCTGGAAAGGAQPRGALSRADGSRAPRRSCPAPSPAGGRSERGCDAPRPRLAPAPARPQQCPAPAGGGRSSPRPAGPRGPEPRAPAAPSNFWAGAPPGGSRGPSERRVNLRDLLFCV